MKKFVFISILFFIFAFQTKAQLVRSNWYSGGIFTNNHGSTGYSPNRNYSRGAYSINSNKVSNGSYAYGNYYIGVTDDYKKATQSYIEAMYKAHGSDKSADSPEQKKVISAAEARRIEFSEDK
jgi:hypothetical protein